MTRATATALSAILFVLGCAQPAVVLYNTGTRLEDSMWGVTLLLSGWLGVFVMQWGDSAHRATQLCVGTLRVEPSGPCRARALQARASSLTLYVP
ncbi:hypothetical protein BHS06_07085 [Myxococcus xanthus]|nr:hypothetical protein BHS06_07085 [Myxococcus xanthus]